MRVLVTGGAGFIGCNAARRHLERGDEVVVVDNMSRHKSLHTNVEWLREAGGKFRFVQGDIRDYDLMRRLFKEDRYDLVLHMAAQVAVTTSVVDPRHDFEVNALGTFNVLEAIRESKTDPVIIYASTNKVYGGMESVEIVERDGRYDYDGLPTGVAESQPLDFHSPYGCSKGAGDQYMVDYSRIYGLRTVTVRQSCIYGYRQFGVEDQGWVAWFTIAALLGRPITIYGDGKQVRDVLFIEDLLDLYDSAYRNIDKCKGQVFNAGGGPGNRMSLLELLQTLRQLTFRPIEFSYSDWRPGDQRVFYCDISKARGILGWSPKVGPADGVRQIHDWVLENESLFAEPASTAAEPVKV